MKRTPKFGPRYGFKKFAEGGMPKAKASSNPSANERISPPDTPEHRKFLAEMAAQQRKAADAESERRAAGAARSKAKSAEKLKAAEAEAKQETEDRKYREAADKYEREHKLRKGGSVKKYARGGGIETRGKTRGKFV
jgi:hypothetical protein